MLMKLVAGIASLTENLQDDGVPVAGTSWQTLCDAVYRYQQSSLHVEAAFLRLARVPARVQFRVMVSTILKNGDYRITQQQYQELLKCALEFPEEDKKFFFQLFSLLQEKGIVENGALLN